jgi:hypothetical protein
MFFAELKITSKVDLVVEQIRVAQGEALSIKETPKAQGHAIEFANECLLLRMKAYRHDSVNIQLFPHPHSLRPDKC